MGIEEEVPGYLLTVEGEGTTTIVNSHLEQAVLGSLLHDNTGYYRLGGLDAEHFYLPLHQRVFVAIETLVTRGEQATPAMLFRQFSEDETVKEVLDGRGFKWLADITMLGFSVLDIRNYAAEIIDLYKRRSLHTEITAELKRLNAAKAGETCDDVITGILAACMKHQGGKRMEIHQARKVTSAIIDDIDAKLPCFSTGIRGLDSAMGGGIYSRKAYCFGARPKNGKTTLMGTVSYNLSQQNVPHLYICAEMGEKQIHQRYMSRGMKENTLSFFKKRTDPTFISKVVTYQRDEYAQNPPLYYVDAPGITFAELKRVVLTAVNRYKVSGFFLDYIQLVGGRSRFESPVEHQDAVAAWVAKVCNDNNIWCCYAAQLNREGTLRGGDGILMAVDQLYTLEYDKEKRTAFMAMEATRYTPSQDVGDKENPGLRLHPQGVYFTDIHEEVYRQEEIKL